MSGDMERKNMKNNVRMLTLILFSLSKIYPLPGPEIPQPKPTISEAIQIAENYFKNNYCKNSDKKDWYREFIIDSVVFQKVIKNNSKLYWAWHIRFRHPRGNDVSVTFVVEPDGSINPLTAIHTD
jgi:hypothetical protein